MDKDISKYELAKIISGVIWYQQKDIDTYRIIVLIDNIIICALLCLCVG